MAGVPPLAGFCAKMYVFFAAMEGSMYFLAVTGVLTSVIGAFYYIVSSKLCILKNAFLDFFRQISREKSISFRFNKYFHIIVFCLSNTFNVNGS